MMAYTLRNGSGNWCILTYLNYFKTYFMSNDDQRHIIVQLMKSFQDRTAKLNPFGLITKVEQLKPRRLSKAQPCILNNTFAKD